MKSLPLALIALLSLVVGVAAYSKFSNSELGQPIRQTPPSPTSQTIKGQASVIDGDTIEIHGTRIRLFGIDAPESGQTCTVQGKAWPCGRRAALALSDKIGRHVVECRPKDRDRYGRVVAVCLADGNDINGWMVAEGWALAYRQYSSDYVNQERSAANAKRGMWQGTFEPPWDWRHNYAQRPGSSSRPENSPTWKSVTPP
ncbi:MAG: thermonuclease family protein [Pseudolabrys sp.]